jgi:[heparan sulfate]-glucosamine 3-sulfotransferase 5
VNVHYKAVRISLYARYLQRWFDVFPPSQIHVVDGDALIRDPFPVLQGVEIFLGLPPRLHPDNFYFNATKGFYCWRRLDGGGTTTTTTSSDPARNETTGLHCLNDSKGRPHPTLDKTIVSKLRRFYNPHNLRFYDMVNRDFGWPEK